jgi:hypothetical protein
MLTGPLTLVHAAVAVLATQALRFQTPAAVAAATMAAALLSNLPRRRGLRR